MDESAHSLHPRSDAATARPPAPAALGQGVFAQVPIEVVVSLGRARPLVRDLLRLRRDSVLPLDRRVEDPVELFVGDRLIARGVLEELDGDQAGQIAVRLIEVADLRDGI